MTENPLIEFVHWFSMVFMAATLVAGLLVRVIPPPTEIPWQPYVIFYNTLQRLSIAARKPWNNGPEKKP